MTTNFFTLLENLALYGNTTLQLSLSKETGWTGCIHFTDPAAPEVFNNKIIPLTFRGTSAYLDEQFITHISEPVQQVRETFANRQAFADSLKAADTVAKNNPGKATHKPTAKPAVPALPAKYVEAMKKVDALASKRFYRQAIGALPSKEKYPAQATAIDKRLAQLRALHGGLVLFPGEGSTDPENAAPVEPTPAEESTEEPIDESTDESDEDPGDSDPDSDPTEEPGEGEGDDDDSLPPADPNEEDD